MTQTTQAHFVRRSKTKRLVIATLPRPRPRQSSCRDSCQRLTRSSVAKDLKTSMWKPTCHPGTLVIKLVRDPCLDEPLIFLLPIYPRPWMFIFFFRPAKFLCQSPVICPSHVPGTVFLSRCFALVAKISLRRNQFPSLWVPTTPSSSSICQISSSCSFL